jgi:hypothetical protein
MAKNVKKFVNRRFIRTVGLDLLERLLAPFGGEIDLDLDALPVEDNARREALFEFFRAADESFCGGSWTLFTASWCCRTRTACASFRNRPTLRASS